MTKLIQILPRNNNLVIDWILSNVCNFKCSYCSPDSNGGDLVWPDIENCRIAVDQITKQSTHDYRIYTILGGEPTVWKNFTKLTEIIKSRDDKSVVNILTNGSRTINWWNRTKPYIDKVSISFHHEFADVNHIIDVVNTIQTDCQTNIQMLMDVNQFDKCVRLFETLRDATNIPIQLKKLQVTFGGKEWMKYSIDQLDTIKQLHRQTASRPSSKRNITSLGITCLYDNGEITQENNHDLIQAGTNKFYGWKCNIGQDLLVISANGNIIPANACNTNMILGNIKDDPSKIRLLTEQVTCTYKECTCGTDIEVAKICQ